MQLVHPACNLKNILDEKKAGNVKLTDRENNEFNGTKSTSLNLRS